MAYADDVDADVIVLGHRGLTYGWSTHLGSVADCVVRNAGRPVLVV
ncbi:universal stress protein [Haloplanus pelagicus]